MKEFKVLSIFIICLFGFLLVKMDLINRAILDSILLILVSIYYFKNLNYLWLLSGLSLISFFQYISSGNILQFLNLSLISLVLLNYKKNLCDPLFFQKIICFSVLYTFIVVIIDLLLDNYVEAGDRISGPFTSSLHLSYFSVFAAVYFISNIEKDFNKFFYLLIIISAIFSGSRIAFIGSLLPIVFKYIMKRGSLKSKFYILFFVVTVVFIIIFFELRSISYHSEAENLRILGWIKFYNYILNTEFYNLLFGNGRVNYGALGFRFIGENAFITESSFIMLIYSCGILGLYLFFLFVIKVYSLKIDILTKILIILFSIFSPFLDSPAILVINLIILNFVTKTRTKSDKKNIT